MTCRPGKHKFEARYDLGEPTWGAGDFRGAAGAIVMAMEASKPKTYVHDVCVRCGQVISRPDGGAKQPSTLRPDNSNGLNQ